MPSKRSGAKSGSGTERGPEGGDARDLEDLLKAVVAGQDAIVAELKEINFEVAAIGRILGQTSSVVTLMEGMLRKQERERK